MQACAACETGGEGTVSRVSEQFSNWRALPDAAGRLAALESDLASTRSALKRVATEGMGTHVLFRVRL